MNLEEQIQESKNSMFSSLNDINIDSLKAEGVSIRVGDKLLKFSIDKEESISDINIIKEDFRNKLNKQQKRIKEKINNEIEKINNYHNSLKIEFERKEKELKKKLSLTQQMPNITYEDALKGLSLVKGHDQDTLCWLVYGVYWPKTLDFKPINLTFSKRLVSPVIYMIMTKGKYVTEVSTRKVIGLEYFDHYHQNSPDCWGDWKFKVKWTTPTDILTIGRQAESILENINSKSTTKSSPEGLPRINTIKNNIKRKNNYVNMDRNSLRQGIDNNIRTNDSEIWSL